MKIELKKKPKNPIIIEGFPGFGLVGTISTEFLIDHLQTELIGKIKSEKLPAMVAIHEGKAVQPMGIFYDKKNNLVILHVITNAKGMEWEASETILELAKQLQAKEIISIEGIHAAGALEDQKTFFYSNTAANKKKLESTGIDPLKEGIVMGTTGPLILEASKLPVTCMFAETASELPDSKAAANVIQILDKYLGLKVDYKPLLKQAEKVEGKIKDLLTKSQQVSKEKEKQELSYVG